jgi:hypothetical protein
MCPFRFLLFVDFPSCVSVAARQKASIIGPLLVAEDAAILGFDQQRLKVVYPEG